MNIIKEEKYVIYLYVVLIISPIKLIIHRFIYLFFNSSSALFHRGEKRGFRVPLMQLVHLKIYYFVLSMRNCLKSFFRIRCQSIIKVKLHFLTFSVDELAI